MTESSQLSGYSELIAAVLNTLMAGGLKRQELSAEDFYKALPHLAASVEEFGELFVDSLVWLGDEGYVRFHTLYSGTEGEPCVSQIAPTALCLQVLEQKVEALGGRSGREVLEASRRGEEPANSYVKAGSLLGGILGGFTRAVS